MKIEAKLLINGLLLATGTITVREETITNSHTFNTLIEKDTYKQITKKYSFVRTYIDFVTQDKIGSSLMLNDAPIHIVIDNDILILVAIKSVSSKVSFKGMHSLITLFFNGSAPEGIKKG